MKKIISLIIAFTIGIMGFAQNQNYEYVGSFGMPYFSVNFGGASPLSADSFGDFIDAFRPTASIEIGTWVTPVYGFSVVGRGFFNTTGSYTFFDESNVIANAKVNMSNFFGGYKGAPRRVEVVAVPGFGWGHGYGKPVTHHNTLNYNLGGELNVNLGKARAAQINFKPTVTWLTYDNFYNLNRTRAIFVCEVGFTYKFKNHRVNSHNFVTNDYRYSQADYDALQAKLNEALNKEPVVKEVVTERIVEKQVETTVPTFVGKTFITFDLNSDVLSPTEHAKIVEFSKQIKDNMVVHIVGSADSGTGTESRNTTLAENRAKAVKDVLIYELNVPASTFRLSTSFDAGNSVQTSRAAVLTIEEFDVD